VNACGVPAALLLARWWSRPTASERELWCGLWADAGETAQALGLDPGAVERLREAAERAEPEALLDEYERLLVGPGRAPCQPYESLWRDDIPEHERALMGPSADEVQGVYRELGVRLRGEAHELPDHLLVEWEAYAYALDQDDVECAYALLDDHLALWMTPFCSALAAEAHEPFYSALAKLTPAWTAALRR